jgi:hypothetical protein
MSDFGAQRALWLSVNEPTQPLTINYSFVETSQSLPHGFWTPQNNRYGVASDSLIEEVKSLIDTAGDVQAQIKQLILLAKERFDYGHADTRFNDGAVAVPNVCGTTKGSCVDINTYLLACANALGIPCQYIAGYWFHPEKTKTLDMHCWLLFRDGDKVIPWDLAHHLKWGVAELAPVLNPAGGRRVAMSFGRGLSFETEYGNQNISHFSEPVWVLPNGQTERPELIIHIEETEEVAL